MKLWVALALAGCLALPLAAQSVRGRLEGRIPSAAIPAVDSLIQFAAQEGLPTEPLIQKALEGGAKHVAVSRIVAAVQLSLGQLRDARDLLVRAGDQPPVLPAELTTVAWARRRGLPAPVIERVVAALGRPPRAAALHAVADLVAHRFDPGSGCWTCPRPRCNRCSAVLRGPRRSPSCGGSCPICRRPRSRRVATWPARGGRRRHRPRWRVLQSGTSQT